MFQKPLKNPTPKNLYIDHQQNQSLHKIKSQFQNLNPIQQYQLHLLNFQSAIKTKTLFQILFINPNPNLTKLVLQNVIFSINEWKMFTNLKWPILHTLIISIILSYLYFSKIDNDCCVVLSKCQLPLLKLLALDDCQISDQGVSHLINGNWNKLKSIRFNSFLSNKLKYIGAAKWKNLQEIHFQQSNFENPIDNVGKLFDFPKLKQIYFRDSQLSQENLSKINKTKQPMLENLDILRCQISGKDVFNLQNNIGWQNLKQLWMGSDQLSKEQFCAGFSNICQYQLPNLTTLRICYSNLSKNTIKNFTKSKWNNLTELRIYLCTLQYESIKVLNKCQWKQLKLLNLSYNYINDISFNYLQCSNWPLLNQTILYSIPITTFGIFNMAKTNIQTIYLNYDLIQNVVTKNMKKIKNFIEK